MRMLLTDEFHWTKKNNTSKSLLYLSKHICNFRWDELNRLAEQPSLTSSTVQSDDLPEGIEQEQMTERHIEEDGTIVTTTTLTSHYSETRSGMFSFFSRYSPRLSFAESPVEQTYDEHHEDEDHHAPPQGSNWSTLLTTTSPETRVFLMLPLMRIIYSC